MGKKNAHGRRSSKCTECELTLPLANFPVRYKRDLEDPDSRLETLWLQPRCFDCNRAYTRRRRLFEKLQSIFPRLQRKEDTAHRVWIVPAGMTIDDQKVVAAALQSLNEHLPDFSRVALFAPTRTLVQVEFFDRTDR